MREKDEVMKKKKNGWEECSHESERVRKGEMKRCNPRAKRGILGTS